MKLPGIRYDKPVQPLQQRDVGQAVATATAKIGLATAAGNLANDIVNKSIQHQANQARSATLRRMSDWSKNNDGVAFYDSKRLLGEGVPEHITSGRETVPSHEVKPQLYEAEYRKVMEEEGVKIYDSKYRDQYYKSAMDDMFINRAGYTVTASKEQRTQQNAQIKVDIDELLIDREYDIALSRVNELRVAESDKQDLTNGIKSDREFAGYVDIVNFKQVPEARKALKQLTAEDSKNMDELKQFKAINMLENFLKEDDSGNKLRKDHYQWLLTQIEKNAIGGNQIDLGDFKDVIETAVSLGVKPKYMIEANTAVKANMKAKVVSNLPADEQLAALQSEELKATTTQLGIGSNYMESIVKGNISYMNKDMLGYYHSKNGNIPTIDFVGIAHIPGATGELLSERMQKHDIAEDRLKVSQGYLKDEEVGVLTDLLLNASPDEVMAFTTEVNGALGRNAVHIYDQLRVKRKELGSLTVVGQLGAMNQNSAAMQVLRGHNYRKENPEVIQELGLDFLPAIHEQLGGVYSNSPRYLSTIKNAILDVYTTKAVSEGLPVDVMDTDILEESISVVTGGLLEHADNKIEPPYYGATQAVMDDWLENLNPEYITELGGAYHYSDKQVVNKLRDEDFTLESYGNGRYVIQTGKGGYLADKAGKGKFILKFDQNAPVVPQSSSVIFPQEQDTGFGVQPIPSLTEALKR